MLFSNGRWNRNLSDGGCIGFDNADRISISAVGESDVIFRGIACGNDARPNEVKKENPLRGKEEEGPVARQFHFERLCCSGGVCGLWVRKPGSIVGCGLN